MSINLNLYYVHVNLLFNSKGFQILLDLLFTSIPSYLLLNNYLSYLITLITPNSIFTIYIIYYRNFHLNSMIFITISYYPFELIKISQEGTIVNYHLYLICLCPLFIIFNNKL